MGYGVPESFLWVREDTGPDSVPAMGSPPWAQCALNERAGTQPITETLCSQQGWSRRAETLILNPQPGQEMR